MWGKINVYFALTIKRPEAIKFYFWMRFKRNDSYNLAQDLQDINAIVCKKDTSLALVRIH